MRTKRLIHSASLLLILLSVMLSGCQWIQDPKSLMSVPRLPTEKANLKSMIASQLPEGAILIRPTSSDDASAIRVTDLNNDGLADTAVVFYETPEKEVRIHGMVFHRDGDSWRMVVDFDGEGIKLDSVELIDITNDSRLDLVVGYGSNDTDLNKGLVIYTFTQDGINKLFEQPYSQFVIDDLDQNGKNQLFIVNNRRGQSPVLTAFDYQNGKMVKLNELAMDKEVNMYINMVSGFISKDHKGIVMDASAGANYWLTNVVVLNKDKVLEQVLSDDMTLKPYFTTSADINGDGIIEIAMPETPSGWDRLYESYEIPYFTNYFQWDGSNGLKLVDKQYRDYLDRFYLTFPKSWYGRVTVDTKSKKDEILIFVDQNTNEKLAEIRFFTPVMWDLNKEKWTYLSSFGDKIIGIISKEPLKLNKGLPKIPELNNNESNSK
ncbi:hypothetical protein [Paenibacillus profundus]|uniref:hypothetical protein n=1 Tax=Paenibacillus profundus TaxID=1173085 RepID=UPI001F3ACA3B|nr:hypothetical protein [Paenibacillus profundus]